MIMFRVKTFGYDSPRTAQRIVEEDPNMGQEAAKAARPGPRWGDQSTSLAWHSTCLRISRLSRGLPSKKIIHVTNYWGASATRSHVPDVAASLKVELEVSKSPIKCWGVLVIWGMVILSIPGHFKLVKTPKPRIRIHSSKKLNPSPPKRFSLELHWRPSSRSS